VGSILGDEVAAEVALEALAELVARVRVRHHLDDALLDREMGGGGEREPERRRRGAKWSRKWAHARNEGATPCRVMQDSQTRPSNLDVTDDALDRMPLYIAARCAGSVPSPLVPLCT